MDLLPCREVKVQTVKGNYEILVTCLVNVSDWKMHFKLLSHTGYSLCFLNVHSALCINEEGQRTCHYLKLFLLHSKK